MAYLQGKYTQKNVCKILHSQYYMQLKLLARCVFLLIGKIPFLLLHASCEYFFNRKI